VRLLRLIVRITHAPLHERIAEQTNKITDEWTLVDEWINGQRWIDGFMVAQSNSTLHLSFLVN
jgi:hypothetical protein